LYSSQKIFACGIGVESEDGIWDILKIESKFRDFLNFFVWKNRRIVQLNSIQETRIFCPNIYTQKSEFPRMFCGWTNCPLSYYHKNEKAYEFNQKNTIYVSADRKKKNKYKFI
jgi:hypothetical protein